MLIKSVNYNEFIPILIAALKHQQIQIDSLSQLIVSCCGIAPRSSGQQNDNGNDQDVVLKNETTIILDQNVPNPFKDETDIHYVLTEDIKKAILLFYDRKGFVIQKVELKERGEGTVYIYAQDLSSGAYTYSLIADGKVIETKTMVKLK